MIEVLVSEKLVVRVPCAVIEHDGKILAGQRNAALSFPLKWEFPGGKVEKNETDEQALAREILEELGVEIEIFERLPETSKDQGWREIILVPFICALKSLDIVLTEHEQIAWLTPEELPTLDWTEADFNVIENYYLHLAAK
jgi:8-oxo-dGTP diphosphatase